MISASGLAKIVCLAWSIVSFNTFQGARSVDADLIDSARFLSRR
jgi:ABC-type nitrate/sulfonate/bicarbonate transport system permease component